VNVVCVVSGVRDSELAAEACICGSGWTPSPCAAGVCVKNANGAVLSTPFVFAGDVELRGSRFVAGLGWSSARKRAICASLRFCSAARAALSFCVSRSLRRSV
jgi:hypothetical protein